MVLTSKQYTSKAIVIGGVQGGVRPTTYDATVGSIIRCGVEIQKSTYTLPPRHIIWLVSAETFDMGDTTTGLATLKTGWTHQGVLALNVGVVDPGWKGPLAAAVVNFSNTDFVIEKGSPFLRLLFHEHAQIPAAELRPKSVTMPDYVKGVIGQSRAFASTFLDMDDLSKTVADKVLGLPRWGLVLSVGGILLGLLAIAIPVGVTISLDATQDKAKIATLETRLGQLEARSGARVQQPLELSKCQLTKLDGQMKVVCPLP